MTDDALAFARGILAAQPFSEQVGARIVSFGDGEAVLEIDIEDRHRQQYGLVHGGVLCYLADNALTFAAGTVVGPSVVTAGLTIDYLSPARTGILRARGTVEHRHHRRVVSRATIEELAEDGTVTLCAAAQGTVMVTEPER